MEKNWLMKAPAETKIIPMTQVLTVSTGRLGSSVLLVTALTSAYGEFCKARNA